MAVLKAQLALTCPVTEASHVVGYCDAGEVNLAADWLQILQA